MKYPKMEFDDLFFCLQPSIESALSTFTQDLSKIIEECQTDPKTNGMTNGHSTNGEPLIPDAVIAMLDAANLLEITGRPIVIPVYMQIDEGECTECGDEEQPAAMGSWRGMNGKGMTNGMKMKNMKNGKMGMNGMKPTKNGGMMNGSG